jgi:hypothetical protein
MLLHLGSRTLLVSWRYVCKHSISAKESTPVNINQSNNSREIHTFSSTGNNVGAEFVEIDFARLMQQGISVNIDFFIFDERRHFETARAIAQLIFAQQLLETFFDGARSVFRIFLRVSASILRVRAARRQTLLVDLRKKMKQLIWMLTRATISLLLRDTRQQGWD